MRKTAWWVLLLAIVGLAAACKEVPTQAAPAAPTGACANPKAAPSGPITITSGGLQRTYLLSLPSPLPTKPAPVIVNLHGAGSDKEQQAVYSQLAVKGPARGFVVVTPDATGQPQQWNIIGQTKSDDVKFIDDLIVDLATRACIDPARLYATGISSGAAMSSVLACRQGERFRAIAPVAGVVFFGPVCSAGSARDRDRVPRDAGSGPPLQRRAGLRRRRHALPRGRTRDGRLGDQRRLQTVPRDRGGLAARHPSALAGV